MIRASEDNPVSQSFEWLHAVLLEHMEPDVPREIYQTNVSTTPLCRSEHWLAHHDGRNQIKYRRHLRKQPARVPKPIPRSDGRFRVARAFFVATLPSVVVTGGTDLPQEFDVVCLGGGVAGEAIAVGLRDSGLTLAVVERELVGGECPYWGCVPSKTLLRSSETLTEAQRARLLAASRVEWTLDFPKVSKRVRSMARDLDDSRAAAAMEATGARLFRGEGKLTDLRTVDVGREQLIARVAVVIANGSTAAIPAIPGLESVEFWTNRQAAIPSELPGSLAILGGGAIGVELGQAFARLGSKVTVIEAGPTFLALEEPEAGAALRPHLEADGITLMIGDPCIAVEEQITQPARRSLNRRRPFEVWSGGLGRPVVGCHGPPSQPRGMASRRARTDRARLVEGRHSDARGAVRRLWGR